MSPKLTFRRTEKGKPDRKEGAQSHRPTERELHGSGTAEVRHRDVWCCFRSKLPTLRLHLPRWAMRPAISIVIQQPQKMECNDAKPTDHQSRFRLCTAHDPGRLRDCCAGSADMRDPACSVAGIRRRRRPPAQPV